MAALRRVTPPNPRGPSRSSTAASAQTQKVLTYANAIMTGVLGMVYAVGDAYGSGSTPVSLGRFALAFSVASSGCSVPTYSKDSPTVLDWSSWALNLTSALLNILGSVNFSAGTSAKFGLTELSPGLLSGLSIGQSLVLGLMFDNADYGEAPTNPKGGAIHVGPRQRVQDVDLHRAHARPAGCRSPVDAVATCPTGGASKGGTGEPAAHPAAYGRAANRSWWRRSVRPSWGMPLVAQSSRTTTCLPGVVPDSRSAWASRTCSRPW